MSSRFDKQGDTLDSIQADGLINELYKCSDIGGGVLYVETIAYNNSLILIRIERQGWGS